MLVPLSVADIMTPDVETIDPDASIRETARAFEAANVGSLVVCENGGPVGIVTESDLVHVLTADRIDAEATVRDVMSDDLVTIDPETPLDRASDVLGDHDFRRLPVVEEGELVGIITTTDLADYIPRLTERRQSDAQLPEGERVPSDRPEMAYTEPDWEFESQADDGIAIGDVVRFRKQLTDDDVEAFAEASGDTNRLHLDDDFAVGTRFGGRIVHGTLASGLISAALARLPGLTIYLSQDIRFLGPIGVGDVATAVCSVSEDLQKNKYRLDVAVYDEEGERAIDGHAVVMMDELPESADRPAEPLP